MRPAKQILQLCPAQPGTFAVFGQGDGSERFPCSLVRLPVIAWAVVGVPCVPISRDEDGEYVYPREDEQGYRSVQPIVQQEPGYFAADDDDGLSNLVTVILPGEDFDERRQRDMLDDWTQTVHGREVVRERKAAQR